MSPFQLATAKQPRGILGIVDMCTRTQCNATQGYYGERVSDNTKVKVR